MARSSTWIIWAVVGLLGAGTSVSGLSCVPFKDNSTWTPCAGMTATKDIHLDQMAGRWFMHQITIPPGGQPSNETAPEPHSCMVMSLARSDRGFLASGYSPGKEQPWRNNATLVVQEPITYPGLWDEVVVSNKGVELTNSRSQIIHQDTKALVIAICPPTAAFACNELGTKPTVLVWGRNATANSLNLESINAKIRQAGISFVDKAMRIDTSACNGLLQDT